MKKQRRNGVHTKVASLTTHHILLSSKTLTMSEGFSIVQCCSGFFRIQVLPETLREIYESQFLLGFI